MLEALRRLSLGIALIAATSGLLLYSDLDSRISPEDGNTDSNRRRTAKVALLQHVSQTVLDDGCEGVLAGLKAGGWEVGKNLELQVYNAEGDMPTAQTMAASMVGGDFDLLITVSTPSLQAVANANRNGEKNHVFGLVTDPFGAGVGISREQPRDHPPHLAGYGTLQPVRLAFETARQLNPDLASVGVVWNPSETNSVAQIELAREVCQELGIRLEEGSVENSAGVGESAAAVIARGVEALWIPGDVVVIVGADAAIAAANRARIPVFSVIPPTVDQGALFDVGADYRAVGKRTGTLASDILKGTDPASVEIVNYMPERLLINEQPLANLKGNWSIPQSLLTRASTVIDAEGNRTTKRSDADLQAAPDKNYKIGLAYFAPDQSFDRCHEGLFDGLIDLGFVEGENLEVMRTHAQAEMVNIRSMLVNLDNSDVDAVVTFSTPVLQSAIGAVKKHPVVFTFVTDPIAAGAATTFEDHHPNITGIGSMPPLEDTVRLTKQLIPQITRLGTLYNNGEANSVKEVTILTEICNRNGIDVIGVPAANTGEVMQAAQAVVTKKVDALYVPGDNTVYQAFETVSKAAADAGLPLINGDATFAGPLLSVGPGFYHSGKAAAPLLARVLLGEDPATIPMENVSVNETKFDPDAAQRLGITPSPAFLKEIAAAQESTPDAAQKPLNPSGKTWKIAALSFVESPPFEDGWDGVVSVLRESGLVDGKDYTLDFKYAQGDIGTLNGIIDAAITNRADIILPLSTPGLQAAIRKIRRTPIIFGIVSDPVIAGAGTSFNDHIPNVAGVSVALAATEMLDLLERHFPQYKRLGTLFCPAEANSENSKKLLETECRKRGLTLETVAANSSSELADAALALMGRPIDAVVQIPDNLSSAGFHAITQAARQSQKPLLSLNSATVDMGAAVAIGRDYYEAGEETGRVVLQVIGGEDPANIPFRVAPIIFSAASVSNAAALGMTLPESLKNEVKELKP